MVYNCRVCKIELTDENWHWYKKENHSYICIACNKKEQRKYQLEHTDIYRKNRLKNYYRNKQQYRDYARKNRIGTVDENGNTKTIFGLKREYPIDEKCEVCKVGGKRLVYHHWDDLKPILGMWICTRCHNVAEYIDSGMDINLYMVLKTNINNEEL
jgi:hypothetical protein